MPFITKTNRKKVEAYRRGETKNTVRWSVGDWCYYYYKPMVDKWKKKPRWTTAHNIYEDMMIEIEDMDLLFITKTTTRTRTAYELAWQVFFQLYVMPYEFKQKRNNGDI